ncbi:MAG: RIP metalloprotease RseP [Phycisphaerales bacterium]|nr:MAG: RIP metalloprotease RseP [Phycisphaerales bacterium]
MCSLLAQFTPPELLVVAQSWLTGLWGGAWPYIVMVIGFSVIIFVHELGHFAVAKWAGVRVEQFAIGFGREIAGFTKGETRYSFNILPFGGFVKMLGQEDFEDKSKELIFKDDPRSFINKPIGHRMAIVSAGVVMNVLFACFLFVIVFMVGMDADTTRIGRVEPDSPAHKAGLRPGDNIRFINDEKILEFNDVSMSILLAPPHRAIKFVVERDGKLLDPIHLTPDYRRPEATRTPRKQMIGIAQGVTPEIVVVGPEIDTTQPDQPHPGDVLVEVDGIKVTNENANNIQEMLVYNKGDIFVDRKDPGDPDASAKRVRIEIPPQFALYPSEADDPDTTSVLGLTPLIRFGYVDPDGRGNLAGLQAGDTVLSWDDIPLPSKADIARSISYNAEKDIAFTVRRTDGTIYKDFVRPKRNRLGRATIQAICRPIDEESQTEEGPKAQFTEVRRFGAGRSAGIEPGDAVLRFDGVDNPTARDIRKVIAKSADKRLPIRLRKGDGRVVSAIVTPQVPGSIDASYNLVADNVLRVGKIVETINGLPSPAAKADIPPGVEIVRVNDEPVSNWRQLISHFQRNAGSEVKIAFQGGDKVVYAVQFEVPHSLRTTLGIGPEAQILSVDGRKTVEATTNRGVEEVHIGYHEGTRAILTELIGRTSVPVEYRPNPLSEPVTAQIDVSADMVDPWLGRVVFAPNVILAPERKILKGDNIVDALGIGLHKTWYFILTVYQTMNRMIFSRSIGVESISGPLGIVSIGGRIARMGFVSFLFFMAIISANLAVINFLPLPIVDGGLMVFLLIEKIKGSPISIRVQVATQIIGLFLIIGAFIFVTYNDALRLWG